MTRPTTDRRALRALHDVMPPGVDVEQAADAPSEVVVAGRHITLQWAGDGSLGELRRRLGSWPEPPDVVAARHLSPGARALLATEGIGWVDETGAAEVAIGTIVLARSGRPPAKVAPPARWTPAALAVVEAVLCGVPATVENTREATGLSAGSCTNALRTLTDLGLLSAEARRGRASGRQVPDERRLLDAYAVAAAALRPTVGVRVGVTWRDPVAGLAGLGRRWEEAGIAWAATGAVAAAVIAPYRSALATGEAYVDAETVAGVEAAALRAGLRVIDGGRLVLRPFPTAAVRRLAEPVAGLQVAPWPRVHVDLLADGVRGEDAAEHLWEVLHAR